MPKTAPGQEITEAAGTNMASNIIELHSTFALISTPSTFYCRNTGNLELQEL